MLSRAAVRTCFVLAIVTSAATVLPAQEAEEQPPPTKTAPPAPKAATPKPAAAAPAPPAAPAKPLVNIKVDVKITDLRGGQPAATKAVSLTVANGESGSARSQVEAVYGKTEVSRIAFLKTDVRPDIDRFDGQKIRLRLSLEYNLIDSSDAVAKPPVTTVQDALTFVLDNGRPLVVAETAEPGSDRRVRLEVTATVLR
jgi:hypothetical protein